MVYNYIQADCLRVSKFSIIKDVGKPHYFINFAYVNTVSELAHSGLAHETHR